jgi:hypothetical protein
VLQGQWILRFFTRELNRPRKKGTEVVTAEVPEQLDWYIWRVLTSEHLTVTLTELKTTWSLLDLADAHDALDTLEALDVKAQARAKAIAERERERHG